MLKNRFKCQSHDLGSCGGPPVILIALKPTVDLETGIRHSLSAICPLQDSF